MSLNKILLGVRFLNRTIKIKRCYSLFEPDYLDALKPKIPIYDVVDIQIKGYDFRILENYQRLINSIADNMELTIEECWATPCQQLHVQKFKDQTNIVETDYKLNVYERNVQLVDMPSTSYATLLRLLEASLPEGVTLQSRKHIDAYDEVRYVPDQELKQLKTQLDEMVNARKK